LALVCNLFENAIRYSPDGAAVRVLLSDEGERVRVRVVDGGPGMPAADRERIFEPIYRSPDAYHLPGYGLGLAIARKVARAHGGELGLGASVGGGAEFVVELPQASVDGRLTRSVVPPR
jgi:signal transduction histidine kinase